MPLIGTSGSVEIKYTLNNSLSALKLLLLRLKLATMLYSIFAFEDTARDADINAHGKCAELLVKYLEEILALCAMGENSEKYNECKRIYIPVLRSAIPLKDPLSGDYREDLFLQGLQDRYKIEGGIDIFTGLELYKTISVSTNAERLMRKSMDSFFEFLSSTFFDGKEVRIVSIDEFHKKGRLITFTVGEVERPLHDLGDGIQALVILMYKIFMAAPRSWIFIEEPEISLHPGLQRIVIDTLLNNEFIKEKKLIVFITTHSNHLLDISIPEYTSVAIFSLERIQKRDEEQFIVRAVSNKRLHALNALGATNSSVFMANCSIWVEGITDRKYMRTYLDAYKSSKEIKGLRNFQEDIHFSFFEYAGSNLEHYIFGDTEDIPDEDDLDEQLIRGQFIANRVFLIADNDNGKFKKHRKWEGRSNGQNFVYYKTIGKEIENLISAEILAKVLKSGYIKEVKPEDVTDVSIKYEDYVSIGMGNYLKRTFSLKQDVEADSGTLKQYYKMNLADYVQRFITEMLSNEETRHQAWECLSEEAKTLTKKIYNFIVTHNNGNKVD